jgi:pimeloyl-ACP methyl ester carboxylesterase
VLSGIAAFQMRHAVLGVCDNAVVLVSRETVVVLRMIPGRRKRGCALVRDRAASRTPLVPDRYAQASPAELLPLGVRRVLIVGDGDRVMPEAARNAYVAAATKAGDAAEVIVVPGGHFEAIALTHVTVIDATALLVAA